MGDTGVYLGIFGGSFLFVAIFACIITIMARAKHRERLINGTAFASIKTEETRFNGKIKRVAINSRRPHPEQIFELQEYYDSSECGWFWEREAIEYTFKMLQTLGYEAKLFKTTGPKENKVRNEVDLSKRLIFPTKEVKKEIKRIQKGKSRQGHRQGRGDEEMGEEEAKL